MYGIMSFQFAFQRNVIIASAKRIENAWRNNPKVGTATTASIGAAFGMLIAGQMAAWIARSMLFNGDDWDEMKEKISEDWLWQSISRAGLFGATDPVVNAFLGLKYERDLTALTAGPVIGTALDSVQKVGKFALDRKSSTKAYQASEAIWNTGIAPIATSMALSIASANPYVDAALGVGLPFLTSKRFTTPIAESAAETLTGKEYKTKEEKAAIAATPLGKSKERQKQDNSQDRARSKARKERVEELRRNSQ